jgi:signal transduction histidine kinase
MPVTRDLRVSIAAPASEARRLAARLTRGGIAAAPDDGSSGVEILVVSGIEPDRLAPYRARAEVLLAIGTPLAPFFSFGADEAVPPNEPEALFRRLKAVIERVDVAARIERLAQRIAALEGGLADAAHDFRAPLHACIGNAELIAKDSELPERLKKDAATVARQAERALQVAERTLESARKSDADALETARLDLGALVERAARAAAPQAKQKGIALVAVPPARPVELRADETMLERVLDNLIANALRATPRGGLVEVSAWRSSPRHVRLCVRDTGEGIPASRLGKLIAGLGPGRGLRICRDIAERHGGDFWGESAEGKGSRFVVELPLAFPQAKPRVLVVSNDEKWVREVARSLREACDVRSATIAAARVGGRTDLILVESRRGQSKSLAALRSAAKGARVPVIELPSELAAARLARTLAHLTA